MNISTVPKLFKRIKTRHERTMTLNVLKRLDPHVLNDLTIDDPEIVTALRKMNLID